MAQVNKNQPISFNFNDHQIREDNNQLKVKPVGVSLTADRFGNERSAVYLHGNASSYLNLGQSDLIKLKKGTISLWVNMQAVVLAGKGYQANPLLMTRSAAGENFNIALGIGYAITNKRFGVQSTSDSLHEATIFAGDTVILDNWYHLLVTIDSTELGFYVNGEIQQKISKPFAISYLKGDSVMIGRTMGIKNERFTNAIVDDIRFYHRILGPDEVSALYHEPDPNRLRNFMWSALRYFIVFLIVTGITLLMLVRNRRNLRKQKEFYELNAKIRELEIKVVRTQMNPHFISNCLMAIQNLILSGQVDRAGEYLSKFSLFLRHVLEYSDKTYLTLEQETGIVKLNVELEQLRFTNDFEFILKVENDIVLSEILIPALITQPFIENAIWHGLLPLKDRPPRLAVNIYRKNGKIYLSIMDNGVGRMAAAKTHSGLSRGTKLATDKIESINNLLNSNDYKLEVEDLFGADGRPAGTNVIIQLSEQGLDE